MCVCVSEGNAPTCHFVYFNVLDPGETRRDAGSKTSCLSFVGAADLNMETNTVKPMGVHRFS